MYFHLLYIYEYNIVQIERNTDNKHDTYVILPLLFWKIFMITLHCYFWYLAKPSLYLAEDMVSQDRFYCSLF